MQVQEINILFRNEIINSFQNEHIFVRLFIFLNNGQEFVNLASEEEFEIANKNVGGKPFQVLKVKKFFIGLSMDETHAHLKFFKIFFVYSLNFVLVVFLSVNAYFGGGDLHFDLLKPIFWSI